MQKVVAVIPAYNEERNIGEVLEKTKQYVDEIIVVDDGSADSTYSEAKNHGAIVLRHAVNMGLGFTLATGTEAAIKRGAEVIVHIDADGQHDTSYIPKFVEEIKKENLDVIIGHRPANENMPFVMKLGNWILYTTSRALFKSNIRDTQSGFRVFRAGAYDKIKWSSPRYAVSSEIVKNVRQADLRCKELLIKTIYKDGYKGTTVFDGMKIFAQSIIWKVLGK